MNYNDYSQYFNDNETDAVTHYSSGGKDFTVRNGSISARTGLPEQYTIVRNLNEWRVLC